MFTAAQCGLRLLCDLALTVPDPADGDLLCHETLSAAECQLARPLPRSPPRVTFSDSVGVRYVEALEQPAAPSSAESTGGAELYAELLNDLLEGRCDGPLEGRLEEAAINAIRNSGVFRYGAPSPCAQRKRGRDERPLVGQGGVLREAWFAHEAAVQRAASGEGAGR